MHARWRFRLAREDHRGDYLTQDDRPLEHQGTDTEAIAIAVRLQEEHGRAALHVEAVSVGRPHDVTDTPGRLLVRIQERQDRRGWTLTGDMMPNTMVSQSSPTRSDTRRAAPVATPLRCVS
jgi:hypothetical protein